MIVTLFFEVDMISVTALRASFDDFAFERAHASFPRVAADQLAQRRILDDPLFQREVVVLARAGDQVALGDLELLLFRVTGEADDLHAVQQGRRNVQRVRRRDEHHARQVIVDLQVMVVERGVLFGVEHLEQSRRRIAAEVLAHLVDLIEQEERVGLLRLLHRLDDLAGHRADVGAAVAADFRFVTHAAERHAHELAARRVGDRFAERGLADAGRADEAEDRALEFLRAALHGEILDDPLFDLLKAVVLVDRASPAPRECPS